MLANCVYILVGSLASPPRCGREGPKEFKRPWRPGGHILAGALAFAAMNSRSTMPIPMNHEHLGLERFWRPA
jgi:hypothetical protein